MMKGPAGSGWSLGRGFRWGVLPIAWVLTASCGSGDGAETRTPAAELTNNRTGTAPRAPALPPEGLQAVIDIEDQSVSGRFRSLRFEARLMSEGQATASFERVSGMTLVATIEGPKRGTLEWRGASLDGFGPATPDEVEVMAHYADRLKADELALIPLDLACLPGTDDLDPAVGAALLFPWQVLLKYQPAGEIPTPREAAASSQCQYLFSPLDAVDMGRVPSPSVVALSTEQPVPATVGYFPFDRLGIPDTLAAEEENPS